MHRNANIIVTGTPGTGKSSHVAALAESLPDFNVLDINAIAKQKKLYTEFDEARNCHVVDDERLNDEIEADLDKGGQIIDWHVCDVFPEDLVDLVVVLRTDNTVLYDRLKTRGYDDAKIEENIDAEIMEVILQEAQESYDGNIVVPLESNNIEDIQDNVDRIVDWFANWKKDNPHGVKMVEAGVDN